MIFFGNFRTTLDLGGPKLSKSVSHTTAGSELRSHDLYPISKLGYKRTFTIFKRIFGPTPILVGGVKIPVVLRQGVEYLRVAL